MADVQFLVTTSKRITRKNRLIPAGETITIPEEFVKLYWDWGHVVQPTLAPAPAPEPAPVKVAAKKAPEVAMGAGFLAAVTSKDDALKPVEEKK